MLDIIQITGRTQHLTDKLDLFPGSASWKERLSQYHFCQNATDAPDIDRSLIVVAPQEQFWGSVPPCSHVVSQCGGFGFVVDISTQSEITDLEVRVGVDQQVSRFLKSDSKVPGLDGRFWLSG